MPMRVGPSNNNGDKHCLTSNSGNGSGTRSGCLTTLPPEILLEILQHVGVDELRANNLETLLICKYWYRIASTVLLEDVKLSATGLKKFLALQQPEKHIPHHQHQGATTYTSPQTKSPLKLALAHERTPPTQPQTASLSIRLAGFSAWSTLIDPKTQQAIPERFKILADWSERTAADITRLSSWLGTLKALTRFRFQAEGGSNLRDTMQAHLFEQMTSYLHADAVALMCRSIPPGRLRVLELDTCGTAFMVAHANGAGGAEPGPGYGSGKEHICPLIGRYVPYLRQLKVRMHRICPEVFGVGSENPMRYTTAQKELVFHLSLYDPLMKVKSAKSAVPCSVDRPCGRDVLINNMIEGANVAARQMPNLKATVLYHVYPFDLVAMDCRTGQTKMVDGQVDWLDNEDLIFESKVSGQTASQVSVTVCAL
ncbi:hypothetical protein ACJ72_05328 [Emergomyces africanus]|uniref:F-box domain-containing protein n=1 Tax=Emergomyces africanus TaxID=1955775 RepID=A0A1B7NU87_9EURO|nr:hypothetical protein ACJ72_05328 [Emergomyces africanus]